MKLPLPLSYAPMEARTSETIPDGPGWQYEPKWDGFRALAFRDGDEVALRSKSGQAFERYFPEIVTALHALTDQRFVLDGELVVTSGGALSFDALLQRVHPAASRVMRLAQETPATYLLFDLLADENGESLAEEPLRLRRAALERFAARNLGTDAAAGRLVLSPASADRSAVDRWLGGVGGALDGIVAKRLDLPYRSGARDGMVKIKRIRSADCVVGGYRLSSGDPSRLGSLLLGLYDESGALDYIGHVSAFGRDERAALVQRLEMLAAPSPFTGRSPGGPSRWNAGASTQWYPVRPELVIEVAYDQVTNGRIRHGARFLRWRPEKAPRDCTTDQLRVTADYGLPVPPAAP
ncbi:MAG TPA: ATP-dependent DNA ligase [Candidatus Acidoferrales bacterium]|nr:ATP-dependent DNA ligase [Candidatus Acidoferrales bacterium]